MRKRIAIAGAVIGTTAGIGIGRVVRTWRTWGIDPDEKTKVLAGDELVARPSAIETRAITVDAPPEAVWPWLTQMGFDRGGWYSYDQLDMGGSSAVRILPEYRAIEVGDVIPTSPTTGFVVRAVEPRRALVLYSDTAIVQDQAATAATLDAPRPVPAGLAASGAFLGRSPQDFAASWAFVLEPLDGGRTRLIERFRVRFEAPPQTFRVIGPIMGFGVFAMVRRQLLGIKERAEITAVAPAVERAEVPVTRAPANGRSVAPVVETEVVAAGT